MTAPVVSLHGAPGSKAQLAPLAALLAPGHVVQLAESAGHGATPPPPGDRWLRLERLALDVLAPTPHPFERVPLDRLAASVSEFLAAD